MDAYEKLFVKMEAKKKLEEIEDANKELGGNIENTPPPPDKTQGEVKSQGKIEVKERLLEESEDEKNLANHTEKKIKQSANLKEISLETNGYNEKRFDKVEAKGKVAETEESRKESREKLRRKETFLVKLKTKLSYFTKSKSKQKLLVENVKPEDKSIDQLKVFKFEQGVSTVELIQGIGIKDNQLKGYALLVDCNIDEKSFNDNRLAMIKKAGIDYIIALGFSEGFCNKVAGMELHLINCSGAMSINEGSKIEVYLEEDVIFDVDNGNEYKYKMMTGTSRKKTSLGEISLGECILIGDNLKVTVLDINKDLIKLCVNALKVITIYLQKSTSLGDEIKIKVLKIKLDKANIAIKTPEDIIIRREC
ncbi:MAG: hypothetical protein GY777_31215 [Candidatus Brocadiaceae bacterium]|nr:hypothetical protein [Candidatus Brocadiaceae bacterium]